MHSHDWDSEVFVLAADDRKGLSAKIQKLIRYLETEEQVSLKDIAFTLHSMPQNLRALLSIVAENRQDFLAKLNKAYARLQEPSCEKIHDGAGIYYFEKSLYKKDSSSLAFLFPGEGAQYLNMLADVRIAYPQVADFFSEFEKLGEKKGNHFAKKLQQVLFLPKSASDAEIEQAKKELKNLGTTMLSVMLVDWALYFLLTKFGLKADVHAGHSLGELVALGSAGCIETDRDSFFEQVDETFVGLQNEERSGKVQEARLFAVGTGKQVLQQMIDTLAKSAQESLFVAMDNCPHQCVVVGPHDAAKLLEEKMQEASIVYELLPFSRPYHTKLFVPLLDEIHTLFANATFHTGNTPVYSCSTAKPFPKEPDAIKDLTVSHWSTPVEFTKMIHNMYDDGIRIFVEVGPRGNLTSFVSDILYGKEKAVIASNVQRRSGITQLNHLLAELLAHKVPLDLTECYRHRNPKELSIFNAPEKLAKTNRDKVLSGYFQVMEQFIALQNDCMHKYLQAKTKGATVSRPTKEMLQKLPLVGELVQYEPAKELVMTRYMDIQEDLFATHHTVGGRTLSRVNPDQYGLPVVPGTFILEMMAESASLLFPRKYVIGLKNVRFMRWLAYEDEKPNQVQITAKFKMTEASKSYITVEITDHGKVAFTGTVILADSYPEAPKQDAFIMSNERECSISLEIMRQNLFHGPLFHGVLSTGRIGNEGIESKVKVLPREQLFCSNPNPQFHLDPVLADCSMHHFVSWHVEQPDQAGRILLPAEIASVELFAPPQPVGGEILSRGKLIDSSSRHFTHEVEAIGEEGKLLFHLKGVKFWRFYVPFGDVNFHGPKDAYFLSKEFKLPAQTDISCTYLDPPQDLRQPGMRTVTSRITLSPQEIGEFQNMKASSNRLDEWLFGRIAAKDAIRLAWWQKSGERLFPADIEITPDAYGRPQGILRDKNRNETLPQVSISHTDGIVMALSSFLPYVGIDIEKIKPKEKSFEEIAFDTEERMLIDAFGPDRTETIIRFWCAKEALAKALGKGLVEGTKTVKIQNFDSIQKSLTLTLGEKLAFEFPHFQNVHFVVETKREADLIIATTVCERVAHATR